MPATLSPQFDRINFYLNPADGSGKSTIRAFYINGRTLKGIAQERGIPVSVVGEQAKDHSEALRKLATDLGLKLFRPTNGTAYWSFKVVEGNTAPAATQPQAAPQPTGLKAVDADAVAQMSVDELDRLEEQVAIARAHMRNLMKALKSRRVELTVEVPVASPEPVEEAEPALY